MCLSRPSLEVPFILVSGSIVLGFLFLVFWVQSLGSVDIGVLSFFASRFLVLGSGALVLRFLVLVLWVQGLRSLDVVVLFFLAFRFLILGSESLVLGVFISGSLSLEVQVSKHRSLVFSCIWISDPGWSLWCRGMMVP